MSLKISDDLKKIIANIFSDKNIFFLKNERFNCNDFRFFPLTILEILRLRYPSDTESDKLFFIMSFYDIFSVLFIHAQCLSWELLSCVPIPS